MNMKMLRPGELRFIARAWDKKLWGIYDIARASWPHQSPELGIVPQQLESKTEAEEIAERLNKEHPVLAAAPGGSGKKKKEKKQKTSTVQAEEPLENSSPAKEEEVPVELELEEVEAYEEIDSETAKKYTEGLF